MELTKLISQFVSWLNADYPLDVPPTDRVPLVALLTNGFAADESRLVAAE